MPARGAVTLFRDPRDPDRDRLLLVLRPLPDHLLAVELLPIDPRTRRTTPRPVRAGRRERARVLRLDPAARAGPRLRRPAARNRHLGHHAVDVRRRRADDQGLRLPGTEFKIAIAGPVVTLADRDRSASRVGHRWRRRARLLGGDARQRPGATRRAFWRWSPGWRASTCWSWSSTSSPPSPSTAAASPGRSRGRSPATATAPPAAPRGSARGSPTSSSRSGSCFFLRGDLISGIWLGADRLHPAAVGARRRRADGVHEPDRGDPRGRRDGRRAGRDPRGRERRAGAGRVLPALPVAVVPGGRPDAALPRPDRARRRRRRSRGRAGRPRPWRTSSRPTPPERCGFATTRRSSRCSATTPCAGSARLMAVDADGRLRGVITADQVGRRSRAHATQRSPAARR